MGTFKRGHLEPSSFIANEPSGKGLGLLKQDPGQWARFGTSSLLTFVLMELLKAWTLEPVCLGSNPSPAS